MTCRHSAGDPSCTSSKYYTAPYSPEPPKTPDSEKYRVEDAKQIGKHLILKVSYENCKKCSFEGIKVLVYLNVDALTALKWKKIDPHFVDNKTIRSSNEAPGPAARFPASEEGFEDAINYAKSKP